MRPLEILITLLAAACFPALTFSRRARWIYLLPALAGVSVILHLLLEGYRWQMVPLYALTAGLCLFALAAFLRPGRDSRTVLWKRIAGPAAGLLLTGLAAALPILLPVPHAPAPTGAYRVGTFSMLLVDESHRELYSGNPQEPRRFMVQFWYPADPGPNAQPAPWVDDPQVFAPAMSHYLGFPSFFLSHVRYVRTDSYLDAPLSSASRTYPVLLYSHGWSGFRQQDTSLMQELASQGYVVVSIEHTYSAIVSTFPDGTAAYKNPAALPSGLPDDEYFAAANKLVHQWVDDIAFTLDALAGMNASDTEHGLQGRLDLEQVGVFGHSFGGGATVEFCSRDPRCKVGVGLDAYVIPVDDAILATGLRQPFLFLYSEIWSAKEPVNFDRFKAIRSRSDQAVVFKILGTSHYDFSDLPMMSPIAAQLGLKGPLKGPRVVRIIDDYVLAAFNRALRGQPTDLLEGPSRRYPELVVP
jgi:predicted dienelactone hydrolase